MEKYITLIVSIVTFLTLVITNIINNWNATELEEILKTNFEKIKVNLAPVLIITLMFSSFFVIYFYWEKQNEYKDNLTFYLILSFIVVFTISFVSLSIILLLIWLISKIFIIKPKFFIKIEGVTGKWYLMRMINKKEVLAKRNKSQYIIINDFTNVVFEKERQKLNKLQRVIFKKENYKIALGIIIFVLVLSILLLWLLQDNILFVFLSIILLIISSSSLIVFLNNSKIYNKLI